MNKFKNAFAAVTALSCLSTATPAQEITLQAVGSASGTTNFENVQKPFWDEFVPEATGGQVVANLIDQRQAGFKGGDSFRMLSSGVIDSLSAPLGYASGDVPELEMLDIPGVIQSVEELRASFDTARPYIESVLRERMGVEPVAFWPTSGQVVWCREVLRSADELAGKKVRIFGLAQSKLMEALGAIPVTLPFSEVVPAMQRGVIDCAVTGANSGNISKWTEVAKSVVPIFNGWNMISVTINMDRWNKLPVNVKEMFHTTGKDYLENLGWQIVENATDQGIWCSTGDERCDLSIVGTEKFTKANLTLVELSKSDRVKLAEIAAEFVLPDFASNCGEECTEQFNASVGEVTGIRIVQ